MFYAAFYLPILPVGIIITFIGFFLIYMTDK